MISSGTPEGLPSRCPLCGDDTALNFSEPIGDATCPSCGVGLARTEMLLLRLRELAKSYPSLELEEITVDSPWPPGGDSMTAVEVMLDLEREMGVQMPADAIDRVDTVGDAIRYFERQLRRDRPQSET
jgi:acyl carrier protein